MKNEKVASGRIVDRSVLFYEFLKLSMAKIDDENEPCLMTCSAPINSGGDAKKG